jgi:hypothetical protein
MEGSAETRKVDAFTLSSEQACVRVSSNIQTVSEKGFEVHFSPGETKTLCFAVRFYKAGSTAPAVFQDDIRQRMQAADQVTREKLAWAYHQMPGLESTNRQLVEYYYRCMLSVLMSRYENPNYITDVFWAVGTWPFTISWDNSYSSDVLALLDPESLREAILTDFREVQMKKTYVGWKGAFWENIYIQEPFALQIMIDAYLRHTGDYDIFKEKAAGFTVWEWMNRWVQELQTNYTNKAGLIDVGYNTEKIIEIRTDGYNHVVPIVNALTVNLLYRMAEWAETLDYSGGEKYSSAAVVLQEKINKDLWNDELGWFENLYPDGSRGAVWTYHLFDLLGADFLPPNQVNRLVGHLQDGVFLGKYGLYSIARKDSVHWDLIDSDWGGGGQYCGMPGRVSRYLYRNGFAGKGWEILKRHMRYINHFPYLPQNPRTDAPIQDRSSMPVQISAGAGMEAIIFGTFGIVIHPDKLIIRPHIHEDIGEATLKNIRFKNRSLSVQMKKKYFTVYENGIEIDRAFYGNGITIF